MSAGCRSMKGRIAHSLDHRGVRPASSGSASSGSSIPRTLTSVLHGTVIHPVNEGESRQRQRTAEAAGNSAGSVRDRRSASSAIRASSSSGSSAAASPLMKRWRGKAGHAATSSAARRRPSGASTWCLSAAISRGRAGPGNAPGARPTASPGATKRSNLYSSPIASTSSSSLAAGSIQARGSSRGCSASGRWSRRRIPACSPAAICRPQRHGLAGSTSPQRLSIT